MTQFASERERAREREEVGVLGGESVCMRERDLGVIDEGQKRFVL